MLAFPGSPCILIYGHMLGYVPIYEVVNQLHCITAFQGSPCILMYGHMLWYVPIYEAGNQLYCMNRPLAGDVWHTSAICSD